MKTEEIVRQELQGRINQVHMLLASAKDCLTEKDYLQCAVRLQMAAGQGEFSELLMNVFDSLTASNTASSGLSGAKAKKRTSYKPANR
jgi:hypothetical protein